MFVLNPNYGHLQKNAALILRSNEKGSLYKSPHTHAHTHNFIHIVIEA